jgi:hypothetical protein
MEIFMTSKTVSQRQELFLSRLVGNAQVTLQTRELGPAVPISHDFSVCAQFFRPWSLRNHIGSAAGRMVIEVPLSLIVAQGCARQVITALEKAPPWMLRSLAWPHSALALLAAGDETAAKARLADGRGWTLSGNADWQAAGVYWATLFEDRDEARICFEKAAAGHLQRYQADQASLAANWLGLCGDVDCALRCLYADMESGPTGGTTSDLAWHPLIAHADAWMTLFDRKDWAAQYLGYASDAAACSRTGGLFHAAMGWMCVLGDERKAVALADRGQHSRAEVLPFAFLYWCCIANDREKARQCLWSKEWSNYGTGHFRLSLAKCLAMFSNLGDDAKCLRHAETLIKEVADEKQTKIQTRCSAAELWSKHFGDGAETMLVDAESKVQESCELIPVAESWARLAHLPSETRLSGIQKVLAHAEDLADNAMDYSFCADSWKTIAGDEVGAERCLTKGEDCARDPQDLSIIAKGWTTLLGRPADARRLILAAELRSNPRQY